MKGSAIAIDVYPSWQHVATHTARISVSRQVIAVQRNKRIHKWNKLARWKKEKKKKRREREREGRGETNRGSHRLYQRIATGKGYRGRGGCRIRYAKCTGHGDPLRRVEKKRKKKKRYDKKMQGYPHFFLFSRAAPWLCAGYNPIQGDRGGCEMEERRGGEHRVWLSVNNTDALFTQTPTGGRLVPALNLLSG